MKMNLETQLSRFVTSEVRKRGASYFREGRVSLTSREAEHVEAVVTGSSSASYEVLLEREGQQLFAFCVCPFFTDRGEICKHIWATVLKADAVQALRGPRGGLPGELIADAIDLFKDDPDWEEEDDPFPVPPPARKKAEAVPAAALWRSVLQGVHAVPDVQPLKGQILYVIDIPVTSRRQQLTLDVLTGSRKLDGGWGGLRALRLTREDAARLPEAADREILSLLGGAVQGGGWSSYSRYTQIPVPSEIADEWLAALRDAQELRVPAADREELLAEMLASPALPRLDVPASMQVEEVLSAPQPRLRLKSPAREGSKEWPTGEVSFLYEGREVAAEAAVRGLYLFEGGAASPRARPGRGGTGGGAPGRARVPC
jgi:SWIM zinc finger